jgi:methionyl-tRNA formyltransferase
VPPEQPGVFYSDGKKILKISTLDGYIQVLELQWEGKKRMTAIDYLNGRPAEFKII